MTTHTDFIRIFFVALNSALLFGLLWYVYKKKLVPTVHQQMQEQENDLLLLSQEKDRLGHVQITLDAQVSQQEQLYDELLHHMMIWRASDARHEQALQQERERIAEQLHHKTIQRAQSRAVRYSMRKVLPDALEQARELLEKKYASAAQGNQFLQEILHTIKEPSG